MTTQRLCKSSVRLVASGLLALAVGLLAGGSPGMGAERYPGQEDLDKATLTKLSAKSMADLQTVIELCESALVKGLDEPTQKFARQLLTATRFEQASRLSRLIFDKRPIDPRWQQVRALALQTLHKAVEVDPSFGDAYLLIARLEALPGGDADEAKKAAEKAVELIKDDEEQRSMALTVRATLSEDPQAALKDLDDAIRLNPRNVDAWRARGIAYLAAGRVDDAMKQFEQIIQLKPDDPSAHQALAQALAQQKQYDQALAHLDQVIESNPAAPIPRLLRAQIRIQTGNADGAVEDLNEVIKHYPKNVPALLLRAQLRIGQEQFDLAQGDIQRVLHEQPDHPQALLLRSLVHAAKEQYADAIADLNALREKNPENDSLLMQLATLYELDQHPEEAITIYSRLLAQSDQDPTVLRRRGDAYLSLGKRADAIRDYEAALQAAPDDPGILNNLAWVLATAPEQELRNGSRALELAKKASEATQYQQAHILSTLAAAFAETGDFDEARKWSEKAVALDDKTEQLKEELQSYRDRKPWRERQEEKKGPAATDEPATDEPAQRDPGDDQPSTHQPENHSEEP